LRRLICGADGAADNLLKQASLTIGNVEVTAITLSQSQIRERRLTPPQFAA